MDAATVLEQYVSDLTNLPAEIAHVLGEIGDKDIKYYETRKRIQQRDNQLHKFIRANGSLAENPKEAQTYPKIRADFEKAMQLQQQKMDLSNTGLYIVAKQMKRLNDEIKKLENEGLLAPLDDDMADAPDVAAAAAGSSRATSSRARVNSMSSSRNSPNAASAASASSRTSTGHGSKNPTGRPAKRLKVSSTTSAAGGDAAGAAAATSSSALSASASPSGGLGASSSLKLSPSSSPYTPADGGASFKANIHQKAPYSRPQLTGDEEEQLYCTCQQVSFGNMVACDNPDCQYEWFHYDCVGLTAPPSGTWYCPPCSKERKEKDFKDTSSNKRKRG